MTVLPGGAGPGGLERGFRMRPALVAFCFLRKRETKERFVSVARRGELAARLAAWVAERGLPARESRQLSADVLSFLIHNGVMMNAGIARGTAGGQPA